MYEAILIALMTRLRNAFMFSSLMLSRSWSAAGG